MKKGPLGALSQLLIVTGDEGYSSQVGFCWLFVDERTEIRWPWRLTRERGGIDSVTKALPAITESLPTTVSPPSTLAFE